MPPSYQETIAQKRQSTAQTLKEQSELGQMLVELKKMQMASLMGSQGKSTVILTDQTDLGDKLKEMVTAFSTVVKSTDTTALSKEQISELKSLQKGLQDLIQAVRSNKPDNSAVIAAIKGLKLDVAAPIINVPEAKVTVKAPAVTVDLKPLQDTIKEYFTPPQTEEYKLDLDCYRAQDITDDGSKQYVGFVNPDGGWYIIENDIKANSMRYVFGVGNYAKAFKNASSYQYQLLNEAVASATA